MDISEVTYKVKSYIVSDLNRGLTEDDIKLFYQNLQYNVYTNYKNKITDNKNNEFNDEICNLFTIYLNGYPDFLLERNGEYSFVEVKLDHDSLRPGQVFFCTELSKIADVTVAYFNCTERINTEDFTGIKALSLGQKNILISCEKLKTIANVKGLKPLWVVAELYKTFNKQVLGTKILPLIASSLNIPKTKIKWFIDTQLSKNADAKNIINKQNKEIKTNKLRNRNYKESKSLNKFIKQTR